MEAKVILSALLVLGLCGCNTSYQLEGFETARWVADPMGCKGERQEMVADFQAIRQQLIGLNNNDLRDVLGKPDKVELSVRNQRFYIYYFEPGPQCEGDNNKGEGKNFLIRFDALDHVSEVSLRLAQLP
jgi:outer membrane protein assembly factor BamE (lipoprotein component of BamABCDE complex)